MWRLGFAPKNACISDIIHMEGGEGEKFFSPHTAVKNIREADALFAYGNARIPATLKGWAC